MILYIGGRAQGKRAYCLSQIPENEYVCLDGASLPGNERKLREVAAEPAAGGRVVLDNLHLWARTCLQEGTDPQEMFRLLSGILPVTDVICDEIGNGIVPYDPFERQWREAVGHLTQEIAAGADRVVRVVCGLPQVIK